MVKLPTGDFVTTSLNGAITNVASTATIGTGLELPATNGVLQLDYDSSEAIGDANGPETITYAAYNSGTGGLTGMSRGEAGTTGVSHENGNSVQCGPSSLYFQQLGTDFIGWTAHAPTYTGFSSDPTGATSRYIRIGDMVTWNYSWGTPGTSDATTFTMTLPVTAAGTGETKQLTIAYNNGSAQDKSGSIIIADSGSIATLNLVTSGAGGWTAANGKDVRFCISYEV